MKKILHHHIHKTGGTTLNTMLQQSYGDRAVTPEIMTRYLGRVADVSLGGKSGLYRDYMCIHGHSNHIETVPEDWLKVVLLRNPVDRVMSLYYDWCSLTIDDLKNSDGSKIYKISSWDTPLHELMEVNIKVSDLPEDMYDENEIEILHRTSPFVRMKSNMYNGMCKSLVRHMRGPNAVDRLSQVELYELAKQVLDDFDCIGFTEEMDESVRRIYSLIEMPVPEILRLNQRDDKLRRIKELGRDIFDVDRSIVEKHNMADFMLYNEYKNRSNT